MIPPLKCLTFDQLSTREKVHSVAEQVTVLMNVLIFADYAEEAILYVLQYQSAEPRTISPSYLFQSTMQQLRMDMHCQVPITGQLAIHVV